MKRSRMHEHAIYNAAPSELATMMCSMLVSIEEGHVPGAVVLARMITHVLDVAPPGDHVLDRLIVVAVQFRGTRGHHTDPRIPCPMCSGNGTTPTGLCVKCGHPRFRPVEAIDRGARGA